LGTSSVDTTILDNDAHVYSVETTSESVYEAGLISSTDNSESTTGTFKVSSTAGVDKVTVGGVLIIDSGALLTNINPIPTGEGQLTITAFDSNTGVISYEYTLSASQTHPDADGKNSITDSVAVVMTDDLSATATADIDITIVDDVPVVNGDLTINSVNDGLISESGAMPVYIPADDTTLTWDLSTSQIPSPLYIDGKEVTVSVDSSTNNVIGTIDNGNTVVFTLDANLADGNGSTYDFSMTGNATLGVVSTATAFDVISGGNTDTATFNFTDDTTGKVFATATVTSSDNDATDSDTVNTRDKYIGVDNNWIEGKYGNELKFDYGTDQIKEAKFSLNGLDSGETAVWTAQAVDKDGNNITLSGTVAGTGNGGASTNDEYFSIDAPQDGYITSITFEADGNDDYRLGFEGLTVVDYKADLDMSFDYTLTDSDNDSADGSINIGLTGTGYATTTGNSVPNSMDEIVALDVADTSTNLTFIVDVSSSMSDTDISLSEQAINSIISQYNQLGDVKVNIIQFWKNSSEATGWQDGSTINANNALYRDKAGTDPEQGLRKAVESYNGTQPVADQDVVIYMGDGSPYDNYLKDYNSYMSTWQNFANNVVDEVKAFGINTSSLDMLNDSGSIPNMLPTGSSAVYVNNINDFQSIVSDIAEAQVSGTVLDNIEGGDAPITIDSIVVDNQTYTSADFPVSGVAIGGDGTLKFDFSTGDYSYSAKASEFNADTVKTFSVNASDSDGDVTSLDVDININESGMSFLYGSDNDPEQFVIGSIGSEVTIENFDSASDALDLSEVITDSDADVAANTLSAYLDLAFVDTDNDGQADSNRLLIDADGDSSTTNDVTTVYIQDDQNTELNISDLKIDYQDQ
ncbi:VWA domain-containing protein, partial [Thiomicrorhabdus sp. ZW0627]|uniref:vWA domain-containing protein n=1 Tax=Thiomicrorhabdus sp. ZW0627 TaxID=3039774 RepID=UPI002436FF5D